MNEKLLLVLSWLPVLAESGLFAVIARFIAKQLKEHFSLPKENVEENKKLKNEIARLNTRVTSLSEENVNLRQEIHNLILELRGIKANESIKKN